MLYKRANDGCVNFQDCMTHTYRVFDGDTTKSSASIVLRQNACTALSATDLSLSNTTLTAAPAYIAGRVGLSDEPKSTKTLHARQFNVQMCTAHFGFHKGSVASLRATEFR